MSGLPPIDLETPAVLADVPGLVAAFTTRSVGVSIAPFDELNLGIGTHDARDHVLENRRRVTAALGFAASDLAVAGQIHGSEVETVSAPGLYPGRDGLVTTSPGVLLAIVAADCAAVLLVDPTARVIGACHAGWRGAVGGILENTVVAMVRLGADPARLRAWISPCIGWQAFQVSLEVAERFHPDDVRWIPSDERPHVDLSASIVRRLNALGLTPDRVSADGRCTASTPELFFSHRAQNGTTGRMMGLVGLRDTRS
jgi:YfiH family protein